MTNPTPEAVAAMIARLREGDVYDLPQVAIEAAAMLTALQVRAERAEAKTNMTLGVGDGIGQLFVHGDYESIKACQRIIFERDALRAQLTTARETIAAISSALGIDDASTGPVDGVRNVLDALARVTAERDEARERAEALRIQILENLLGWN